MNALRISLEKSFVAAALLLAACGDSDGKHSGASGGSGGSLGFANSTAATATSTAGLSEYCRTYCGKVVECEKAKNASAVTETCKKHCGKETGDLPTKVNDSVVSSLSSCAMAKDCWALKDSHTPSFFVCVEDVAQEIPASAQAKKACNAMGAAYEECNDKFEIVECLSRAKMLDDDVLQDAISACTGVPCNRLRSCIETSVGISSYLSLENMDDSVKNVAKKEELKEKKGKGPYCKEEFVGVDLSTPEGKVHYETKCYLD